MNKENKRIVVVLIGLCLMFISLIVYISYFQIFEAEAIKNNSYNKRLWINEESILRGSIYDRNGKTLAYSEKIDDTYKRYYIYGRLYSHIIGYSYREYGKSGLELQYNNTLLNINENAAINEIKNIVAPTTEGNSIKLTIDHELQAKARTLLKGKKGSIVAMNPSTGEIYAMVSLPDFDVANLKADWKAITESPDSPLINRATQGLYPPGSTFKLITTIAVLNTANLEEYYNCTGSTNINGYVFKDYQGKAHGNIDLRQALIKSCNTYFATKSIEIGKDRIGNTAERFMINNNIPFDLPIKSSQFPFKENLDKTDIAAAAIGQGKVLVTPLNMALIVSGIANEGQIVKPILVKEIISKNNKILKKNTTEVLSQGTDSITANKLKDMMVDVVKSGTGKNARIKNIKVAGKTGTAENSSGKSHAWFVGFAPADEPKIAIAVILEEEGSTGGKSAAPIARDIMIHAINNIKD
ncbi:peptidoglycan glycosyltransferase [Tissierella praeacuta DSM 18095]|uniref:Peptidoglycan glycosyltransferase n=1 Tax=Tissierella praeacuta DSM 18095 TaxID=1123404 RepID=A0A1M4S5G4_9FIRM|nr:penicillin-binding transpeptidase domain-containing protein [Tissierella praeacuta]SHE27429.1 peptidoglycan glycosyltransferase [Tissierella praeacuta DSM 18095]SUP00886.1 Penicillin-binding protein A [Tissierella praeacuta]